MSDAAADEHAAVVGLQECHLLGNARRERDIVRIQPCNISSKSSIQ
jgi:hypothetical protein